MTILVASDKFKGSLSALQVCELVAKTLQQRAAENQCIIQPLADGGDGTLAILRESLKLDPIVVPTIDPLGRPLNAEYLVSHDTAYVELAEASGIVRLREDEYNILTATTRGTGRLIQHAISSGYKNCVLSIGGSCSNDMGLGIAYELGFRFFKKQQDEVIPAGGTLMDIHTIVPPSSQAIELTILCDVDNPLYGPRGAAQVYGQQKGASSIDIAFLDKGAQHVADVIRREFYKSVDLLEGGGAAGGVAAGLYGLLSKVKVKSGFEVLSGMIDLDRKINSVDHVITGEGRLDSQSFDGKVVGRVLDLCKKYDKPLTILVGENALLKSDYPNYDKLEIHDILSRSTSLKDAVQKSSKYIRELTQLIQI